MVLSFPVQFFDKFRLERAAIHYHKVISDNFPQKLTKLVHQPHIFVENIEPTSISLTAAFPTIKVHKYQIQINKKGNIE